MTNFLAIVNRYEFAQFYRFGYMFISGPDLLPFSGIDSNVTKTNLISHFQIKTPFEYDEEYLILHLYHDMDKQNKIQKFLITDLKSIYPLSSQAKQSIQERIDSRIKLEEPIFESLMPAIISNIQHNEIEMSISALWTIFDLDGSSDLIKNKIGVDHIFKGLEFRKEGIKAFQTQNQNIWSILIAYDRYEFFPNTTLGYFFDAGQVFAYSKQSNFENSKLFTLLKSIKEDSNTAVIISELENSEKSQSYISNTNFDGLKFHIAAPLYLMLKDDLRTSDDLKQSKYFTKSSLDYLKTFEDDFKAAVILLGSFFGYKKVYDLYYDKLNLSFFKNYKKNDAIENNAQTEIVKVKKEKAKTPEVEGEKENTTNIIIEPEEILPNVPIETTEVFEAVDIEFLKEELLKKEVETTIENSMNEIPVSEESLIIGQDFNIETFILDILKQQGNVLLTELGDKIKIARSDKKKMTNTELEREIIKTETLEVTEKSPKKVQRKTGFVFPRSN
ncbi:MAG: hypothetical protein KA270_01025 [Saprospiraceae bacterium]|nr:hypothetical protein [Saprospiraceae bacterium]MBP6565712.1 hypothetical protein [Saprospiraceae bacterium]